MAEADRIGDLEGAYATVSSPRYAVQIRQLFAYDKGQRGKACEMFASFWRARSGAAGSSSSRSAMPPPESPRPSAQTEMAAPRSKSQKRRAAHIAVGEARKVKKSSNAASPGSPATAAPIVVDEACKAKNSGNAASTATAKSPNSLKGYDSSDSSSDSSDSEVDDVQRSVGSLSLAAPAQASPPAPSSPPPQQRRTTGILKSSSEEGRGGGGERRNKPGERTRTASMACKDFTVTVRNAWTDGQYSSSPKGGTFVTCDACGQRKLAAAGGVLLRHHGKPSFASDTYICQPCNTASVPAPQTPAPPPEHAWDFSRGHRDWHRQSWAQHNRWWY